MPIEEMSDKDLAQAHSEMLAEAIAVEADDAEYHALLRRGAA